MVLNHWRPKSIKKSYFQANCVIMQNYNCIANLESVLDNIGVEWWMHSDTRVIS